MEDCSIFSVLAMEVLQSCTKPLILDYGAKFLFVLYGTSDPFY